MQTLNNFIFKICIVVRLWHHQLTTVAYSYWSFVKCFMKNCEISNFHNSLILCLNFIKFELFYTCIYFMVILLIKFNLKLAWTFPFKRCSSELLLKSIMVWKLLPCNCTSCSFVSEQRIISCHLRPSGGVASCTIWLHAWNHKSDTFFPFCPLISALSQPSCNAIKFSLTSSFCLAQFLHFLTNALVSITYQHHMYLSN